MAQRGFTLLEVLMAIVLVGTLSAIAVPEIHQQLDRWRLSSATRQVVMDLKVARARAIAAGAAHRLHFAVGGGYRLERQRISGTYGAVGPAVNLPTGVRVVDCTAAGDAVAFRPRGHAVTFGSVTLENAAGDRRRVVVDIAGRLRVQG